MLAERFWTWIGPASLKHFQWFSGLGVGASKKAVEPLGLVSLENDLLILKKDLDAFNAFKTPKEPSYALTGDLDSIVLLCRNMHSLIDAKNLNRPAFGEKGEKQLVAFMDMPHHAIYDRGQLIGFWEFDAFEQKIVWQTFSKPDASLKMVVQETEKFVQGLGDARSFSLDSPESRKKRVASLR
jgi:hypothetical protein